MPSIDILLEGCSASYERNASASNSHQELLIRLGIIVDFFAGQTLVEKNFLAAFALKNIGPIGERCSIRPLMWREVPVSRIATTSAAPKTSRRITRSLKSLCPVTAEKLRTFKWAARLIRRELRQVTLWR